MSDWIKKQAQQIKRKEAAEEKERAWQIHQRQLVSEQWEAAWRDVRLAMRKQVEIFNAEFPDDQPKHIAMSDEGDLRFTLQRSHGQSTHVVQTSAAIGGVHLRVIHTDTNMGQRTNTFDYRFGATTDGQVGVASNGGIKSPDKAAETILGHLF